MIAWGGLILAILTGGRIDYLEHANRPWCVRIDQKRITGRGKTLEEAMKMHFDNTVFHVKHFH